MDVEHLKFGRITVIAAWHTEVSKNKLRKEREIKTHEEDYRCDSPEELGIKFSRNLGPPEMESTEIAHYRGAHHDVVEMGNDKICVVDVHKSGRQSTQNQLGRLRSSMQAALQSSIGRLTLPQCSVQFLSLVQRQELHATR